MNKLLAAAIFGVASSSAQATCIIESSYGSELDAADHVFVATITKGTLDGDPADLQKSAAQSTPSEQPPQVYYKVSYDYSVLSVLKGDPSVVGRLEGSELYDKPDGLIESIAESSTLRPGDVVLVVANGAGPVPLSFCGPTKPFEWALSNLRKEGRHDLDSFPSGGK